MKKLLTTLAIFAFALIASELAFGQTTSAQPAPKRQWYRIQESVLKFGVANEFYEFRVKERVPALKNLSLPKSLHETCGLVFSPRMRVAA